jgi:hypothetical protein
LRALLLESTKGIQRRWMPIETGVTQNRVRVVISVGDLKALSFWNPASDCFE